MSETRTSALLQTSSHVLVVGAGLVYLFGFIVVSVFDASYGVSDFSLFRTKVIAVGTLFIFLMSLPVLVTFRMFGIFGLRVKHANLFAPTVSPKNVPFLLADVALYIPFACTGIAWFVLFLFTPPPMLNFKPGGLAMFPLLLILAAVGHWGKKHFDSHPFYFVIASFLASVALLIILFRYTDRTFFWLVVWFSFVAMLTLSAWWTVRDSENLRSAQWERLFLTFVPLIFGLYAVKIYPHIRHEYGGGSPVPVVLHLTKRLSIFDSESVAVSLVDETEQGYYVLRDSDKALFVARGLVEEVEFLRSGQASQAPQSPINFR